MELHGYFENVIPLEMRNWTGEEGIVAVSPAPPDVGADEPDSDLSNQRCIEDVGGALGTYDDSLSNPTYILESKVLSRVVREDFEADKWLNQTETVWEHQDVVYVVYKANSRINMPALDGRSGAPHPCMVS